MKLSYKDLVKREVINVTDGKSYGYITDLELDFPRGVLTGITVQGRRVCPLFKAFNRSQIYIAENQIIKIGGDVILVNVNCGQTCADSVNVGKPKTPPCPPKCPQPRKGGGFSNVNASVNELLDDGDDGYDNF